MTRYKSYVINLRHKFVTFRYMYLPPPTRNTWSRMFIYSKYMYMYIILSLSLSPHLAAELPSALPSCISLYSSCSRWSIVSNKFSESDPKIIVVELESPLVAPSPPAPWVEVVVSAGPSWVVEVWWVTVTRWGLGCCWLSSSSWRWSDLISSWRLSHMAWVCLWAAFWRIHSKKL